MNIKMVDSLRRVQIFRDLGDLELLKILRMCKIWQVPAGEIICEEGEEGDELFIIQQGCVEISLTVCSDDGKLIPATISVLYSGQSFGELVLLDGMTRSATVRSIEPTVLLVLRERDFSRLCDSDAHIGYSVMRRMAAELSARLRSSNLLLRHGLHIEEREVGRC